MRCRHHWDSMGKMDWVHSDEVVGVFWLFSMCWAWPFIAGWLPEVLMLIETGHVAFNEHPTRRFLVGEAPDSLQVD
jgi:hypothetical protein